MDQIERHREVLADALTDRVLRQVRKDIDAIATLKFGGGQLNEAHQRIDIMVDRADEISDWLRAVTGQIEELRNQVQVLREVAERNGLADGNAPGTGPTSAQIQDKRDHETSTNAGGRKDYLAFAHRLASIESALGLVQETAPTAGASGKLDANASPLPTGKRRTKR